MNLQRMFRRHSTLLQFAFLFLTLFYVIYHIKQISLRRLKPPSFVAKEDESKPIVRSQGGNLPPAPEKYRTLRSEFGTMTLTDRILASKDYILDQVKPDGTFVYRVNFNF